MITVTNISPAIESSVQPPAVLGFDVTSTTGLLRILVCVDPSNSGRAPELAHDGDSFQSLYEDSTRIAIVDGFRYVLRRSGGWYAAPRPLVFAVDLAGKEL